MSTNQHSARCPGCWFMFHMFFIIAFYYSVNCFLVSPMAFADWCFDPSICFMRNIHLHRLIDMSDTKKPLLGVQTFICSSSMVSFVLRYRVSYWWNTAAVRAAASRTIFSLETVKSVDTVKWIKSICDYDPILSFHNQKLPFYHPHLNLILSSQLTIRYPSR